MHTRVAVGTSTVATIEIVPQLRFVVILKGSALLRCAPLLSITPRCRCRRGYLGFGNVLGELDGSLAPAVEFLLRHGYVPFLRSRGELGLLADYLAVVALKIARELFDAVEVRSLGHKLLAVQVCRNRDTSDMPW